MKMKQFIFFVKVWTPVILMAAFIFMLSNFGSSDSDNQSGFIVNILKTIIPNLKNSDSLVQIVRKAAHFTEYTILGFLTARAMKKSAKNLWLSAPICAAYAVTDELHQSIIPGRSCEFRDVLIDTLGAIFGAFIYKIIFGRTKAHVTKIKA